MASLKTRQRLSGSLPRLSAEALTTLERHPVFRQARTVLLYHSLPDEPDTHAFIRRWQGRKRVLLPVVRGDELELREYTGPEHMTTGAFGIEEPEGGAFTDYDDIDLAVVPGVAFDRAGNRLGRGKGYYDRLLPKLGRACKIGLCFSFQIVEHIPAEPHDIRMDLIIS